MATLRLYLDTRVKRQDGTFSIRLAVNHHGGTAFIPSINTARRMNGIKGLARCESVRIVMQSTTFFLTVLISTTE